VPDQLTLIALLVHAAATWFMVGLIWFVQIVHYPLFTLIPTSHITPYAASHQSLTTRVVAPAMLIELVAAVALFFGRSPNPSYSALLITGAALLAAAWASTFLIQVPLHRALLIPASPAHHAGLLARLVATNWIRTVAWTIRGAISIAMLQSISNLSR